MVTEITMNEKTLTLSDLISRFLSRRNLARTTHEYYAILLGHFRWFARSQGWPDDPANITRGHIREFLDYVATERYRWPEAPRCSLKKAAPATVHHYGKVVKTFFNWAEDEEYLDVNPTSRLKLGKPRYREVEPYSDDEIRAMLELCEDDGRHRYRYLGIRNKAIVSIFVGTGLRVEELSKMRLSALDPGLRQARVMGKGAKARTVPISTETRKALKRYLQVRLPGGDELWKTDEGEPMKLQGVKIMVARLKRRAGITGGGGAHRFRHYFATRYLEASGDLNSLRLLLGHATLDMVLKYARCVDVSKAIAQHEQFDPLDRLYRGANHDRGDGGWGWRG